MVKKNDFWLDDPEWEILKRKAAKQHVSKKLKQRAAEQRPVAKIRREEPKIQSHKESTDKETVINLKLSLPKVKLPDFKQLLRTHQKKLIKAGVIVLVAIAVFGTFKLVGGQDSGEVAGDSDSTAQEAGINPLVPLEGLKDDSGKNVPEPDIRVDKEKGVVGYRSQYNGVQLTLSQQALPEQLKTNPGQLEGIARSVNAHRSIDTQKGKAYIATNDDEAESQIAVFATDEVLVFVRSTKTMDDESWIFYINQLNPEN